MSDNITLIEKSATEPYKLPAPEASENVDAWIEYFYTPPDDRMLIWPVIILLLVGVSLCSWGIYKWLKKKEKTIFTGRMRNQ